jgi:hypothetical protein
LTAKTESGKNVFSSPGITGVESSASTGETSGEETRLGLFHVHFIGVKQALLGTCTGTGEASGVVLALGEYHIYWDPDLGIVVVVFLVKQTQFSCGSTSVTVEGCAAGSVTPESTKTNTLLGVLATAGSPPDDTIITVLNSENTAEFGCYLLTKVGAGATELAALQSTQLASGFEQNGKQTEVEVMPL